MSDKPKIVPNPEATPEEEPESKSKFKLPIKTIRNAAIAITGVVLTGYVIHKIRGKDDDNDNDESDASPWVDVFIPVPPDQASNQ